MVRALRIDAIAITYCILHHVPITSLSWNSSPPSSCTLSSRGVSIIPSASSSHQRYFCLHEMPSNHRRSVMTAFIPGHDRCFKRRIPGQSGQQNCYGFGAIGPSAVLNVNQYNNRGSSNWVSQHQHLLLHHTSSSTLFSSANDSFESSPESKTKTTKTRSQQSKKTSAENTNNKKSTPKKKKTPTKKKTSAKPQTPPSYATMSTAVCIVPPDDAWDTIQRARHLARDTSFYKWPPAIRLFHPFAPKHAIPSLVGKLAEWIEEEGEMERDKDILGDAVTSGTDGGEEELFSLAPLLKPFEVTLDSILILPHWEVLDARVETLEERMPQVTVGESDEQLALRRKREEGVKLIEREVRKGKERKLEREKKRAARKRLAGGMIGEDGSVDNDENHADARSNLEDSSDITDNDEDDESDDLEEVEKKKNGYNGPCVIYLSPSDESRITLEYLRETLCEELFPMYDAFSPSSSVTPYPEQLPRKAKISNSASSIPSQEIKFRPLLPIGRFPTVDGAIKTAKVLQEVWEPLTFNVTDIQFISRNDDDSASHNSGHDTAGVGFGSSAENKNPSHWDIPEVRYRRKHGTLSSSRDTTQRLALTSAGEVEDVSNKGVYGCDAMVMLLGEEPEEDVMNEESSLAMLIMDDEDGYDGNDYVQEDDEFDDTTSSRINYDEIFTTAEREYQRMQAHEESPPSSYGENGDNGEDGEEEIRFMGSEGKGIEEWLDDDELLDDEGATVVVGRSQFFMGAMRDYVGMPASSAFDAKDRIMGGGVSAVARRKGSVSRLSESWDAGDYGKKDQDIRPW